VAAVVRRAIRVFCDAESHAPRVATVGHLAYAVGDGRGFYIQYREDLDAQRLDRDQLIPRDPDKPGFLLPHDSGDRLTRTRDVYECPLCGLGVELTNENVRKLTMGLAGAGVTSVRLASLAASL
jgi:hypothetical protein